MTAAKDKAKEVAAIFAAAGAIREAVASEPDEAAVLAALTAVLAERIACTSTSEEHLAEGLRMAITHLANLGIEAFARSRITLQ